MVDTKAVSVRLPLELLNELNTYATDKGMVRGGDANIGGAIIAILRGHFGKSDNVKQMNDNVDIKSIVNNEIAAKLSEIKDKVKEEYEEEYGASFRGVNSNFNDLLKQRDREINDLTARVVALETASSEATATEKKSHLQLVEEVKKSA